MNAAPLRTRAIAACLCAAFAVEPLCAQPDAPVAAERPRRPVSAVHEAYFEFSPVELRFRSVFHFHTGGRGPSSVRLTLPEGARIDGVEAPNLAGYHIAAGAEELHVSFINRGAGNSETVTIAGSLPFDPGLDVEAILLPIVEPKDVDRETGRLHLFAPAGLRIAVDREIATGAVPTVARPEPVAGLRHVASWAYRGRPVELLVEMAHDPLRMTAQVTTNATVHSRLVELSSRVEYRVESGRTDLFQIAVPEAVADHARIEPLDGLAVAQITCGEPLEDGWIPYTIVTREPVSERAAFRVGWELTAAAVPEAPIRLISHAAGAAQAVRADAAGVCRLTVEPVRVLEPVRHEEQPAVLRRVQGRLTVGAGPRLEFRIEPSAGSSQPVALEELRASGVLPAVRAFDYDGHTAAWDLTWGAAAPPDLPLRVDTGRVEILMPARRGEAWARYRCRYQVRTRAIEELLLEIPQAGDPAHHPRAWINGEEVILLPAQNDEDGPWTRYRIGPPPGTTTTNDWQLVLEFRVKLDRTPFRGFGSSLQLPLPRIGGGAEAPEVLETVLWIPDGFALVGAPAGHFPTLGTSVEAADAQGLPARDRGDSELLNAPASGFAGFSGSASHRPYAFQSFGADDVIVATWWNMRLATWVLSTTVLLAAFILRPTSWRNRLSVLVLCGFAIALWSVAAPAAATHALFAARFGVAAGLLLWIIGRQPARSRLAQAASHAAPAPTPAAAGSAS